MSGEDWKSVAYRQKVVLQFQEFIRKAPAANQRNAEELELQVFQKATKKEEYMQLVARVMMHMNEMAQNSNNQQNNPHLAEVLTRHPGPGNQINVSGNQATGPAGSVGTGTNFILTNQNPNMAGPRMGQQMPPNLQNHPGEMGNWQGNTRMRLNDIQIAGVNKRQQGMTLGNMAGQGKMTPLQQMPIGGQGGNTTQIGQVSGSMVGSMCRGVTMQPRVPSPGFPRQGTPNSNPTSASPAPPMSAPNSQPSPAFVTPSPTATVPSPVGGGGGAGMGRGAHQMGVPSPGGMIHTPGQPQQQSPATQMTHSQQEEVAYREKVHQLRMYINPLGRMIQKLGNEDGEKSRKMKQLYEMLQNPQRRMSMDTLMKCELVLRKLVIQPENETPVPPNMEKCMANLEETLSSVLKSPYASHTLHRTISPALSVLLGPTYISHPVKPFKTDNPLQPPPETPNISDIVQGEVARLNARFRVNLDCQMPPGSDELTLICQLDDPNLPCVPPITLTIPAKYPEKPPRCDLLAVDYETTDFLKSIRESMLVRLKNMPPHCSLTMMLHSWEMSIRQACSPKSSVTNIIATALGVSHSFY